MSQGVLEAVEDLQILLEGLRQARAPASKLAISFAQPPHFVNPVFRECSSESPVAFAPGEAPGFVKTAFGATAVRISAAGLHAIEDGRAGGPGYGKVVEQAAKVVRKHGELFSPQGLVCSGHHALCIISLYHKDFKKKSNFLEKS